MKDAIPLLVILSGCALAVVAALLISRSKSDEIELAHVESVEQRAGSELVEPERVADSKPDQVEPRVEIESEADALVARMPSAPELARLVSPIEYVDPSAVDDALALVSPQGIFERTADWWNQEDFLALTGDELARLVPDAEGYAFGGSRTLLEFVGALPTLEDCERGFESKDVQRELVRVASLDLPINSLGLTPFDQRDEKWRADFATLLESQRAAELDLARALERSTGFAHWSILCRAFGAWNQ